MNIMFIYPLDYFDFERKHIVPQETLSFVYIGYSLKTKIETLETNCKKCNEIVTKEEIEQHGGMRYTDRNNSSKN